MATTDRSTVVGVFTDRAMADRAIEALYRAGFTNEQIGFAVRNPDLAGQAPAGKPARGPRTTADKGTATAAGVVSGGVVGGIVGAAAALLIPGIGPVVAGGVLIAALGGAAVGAVAGGLIGALTSMGVPEEEARYYQEEFAAGRTLVTVKAGSRYQEALNILRAHGAYDVTERHMPAASPAPAGPAGAGRREPEPQAQVRSGEYNPNIPAGAPLSGAYNPEMPAAPPSTEHYHREQPPEGASQPVAEGPRQEPQQSQQPSWSAFPPPPYGSRL
ncbi:MAG: hypothetical protein IMW89_01735 [Ktedonobacteraceae bacterium]|nr:hypothetical protein [Ktedonobacteraceae bacterium]